MSTSYVPTGFKTAQKFRSRPSNPSFVRKYEEEDDNQYLAHKVKRKNQRERIRHFLDSIKCFKLPSSSPTTCLAAPKKRNFN
ncbi:hypothetical protein F53441_6851 [Fusarium austroafricanum]|uniref:Uncharacterized protein n=1 Tax=Fusarium austroafricanum TaxID=2364996 RepID=A0A8H4KEW1_9HYPO|nr:hypothetical protein F53441_6851 [Fusarium austroafricanum]